MTPTPSGRLGQATNPMKPLTGPAVSPVNMGAAGMPGMNASNTGNGARAVAVNMGSGSPNGSMNGRDNAAHAVQGVKLGVPGGTGPMNSKNYSNAPVQVQLQTAQNGADSSAGAAIDARLGAQGYLQAHPGLHGGG